MRKPPSVVVIAAVTSTTTSPSRRMTSAPAASAAFTICPTVRSLTRSPSIPSPTVYQARAPGWRAVHCTTSISDQVRVSKTSPSRFRTVACRA
jgi:hypothetical protein